MNGSFCSSLDDACIRSDVACWLCDVKELKNQGTSNVVIYGKCPGIVTGRKCYGYNNMNVHRPCGDCKKEFETSPKPASPRARMHELEKRVTGIALAVETTVLPGKAQQLIIVDPDFDKPFDDGGEFAKLGYHLAQNLSHEHCWLLIMSLTAHIGVPDKMIWRFILENIEESKQALEPGGVEHNK